MHSKERFQNNYDFLRIFAATCIIFYHSFALVGKENQEPLVWLSDRRINFSFIGLSIFFCISGYLIAKSAVKSPTLGNYLWKRLLRIQPLLIVTCFFTVFLLGPIFTELSFKEYFLNGHTYSHFRNILPVFGIQFTLPGVFIHQVTDRGVNGSLWTLIVEERMYLLMMVVFLYRKDKSLYFILLIVLLNVFYLVNRYFFYGEMVPYFSNVAFFYSLLFLNSAALYLLNFRLKKNLSLVVIGALIVFMSGILFPEIDIVYFIALPLLINGVAKINGPTNYAGKYGDFTYGTYVFSFPVQQILIQEGMVNPYLIFLSTFCVVLPLAVLSWNLIEKRFLKLKHKVK
jgi:peptidoglycan/LPS O-acetylase OafA/YrhL